MSNLLLAAQIVAEQSAQTGQAAAPDAWDLALQYIVYGIVIVLSIIILIFIRKRTRLPRHGEVKKKLDALLEEVEALSAPAENRMSFIKRASRALYQADNLVYICAMLSEKERYSDLGTISSLLGEARAELVPYKYGKKEAEERDGIEAAAEKVRRASAVMDGILERDREIKRAGK